MLHLSVFAGTVTAGPAFSNIPAPTDGWANVQRNRLILPTDTNLIAAQVIGTSIGRAQIDCENFREVAPVDLFPFQTDFNRSSNFAIPFYPPAGKKLPKYSGISGLSNDPLSSGGNRFMLVWFGDTPKPMNNPDVWTIFTQFTGVNPNLGWAVAELNLVNNIPTGTYQLVGAVVFNATIVAGRFRFRNQTMMMGSPCTTSPEFAHDNAFRRGGLGVWGTFKSTESMYFEYIGPNFSPSVISLFLDLIKIG